MKKFFALSVILLGLTACDQKDHKSPENPPAPHSSLVGVADEDTTTTTGSFVDQAQGRFNGELAKRIKDTLQRDGTVSAQIKNIQIKADSNGLVTLRGTVETDRQKEIVGRLVGNLPGVKQVDNQLQAINVGGQTTNSRF